MKINGCHRITSDRYSNPAFLLINISQRKHATS